jgi:hypothetical protein
MIAISNTSPLILLDKVDCLWVLGKLFEKVYISPSVNKEWLRPGDYITPQWIIVSDLDTNAISQAEKMCRWMDKGEADTIALSSVIQTDFLLLDDLKARRHTKALGLPVTGTVGVLVIAKRKGLVAEVKPLLEELKKHRFYLSDDIYAEALKLCSEK